MFFLDFEESIDIKFNMDDNIKQKQLYKATQILNLSFKPKINKFLSFFSENFSNRRNWT